MNAVFVNDFADFLEDRLGKALFALREKNEDYRKLSDEYATLTNGQYQSVDEYQQVLSHIADICVKRADIEKRALFLAGMREHAAMKDALTSDEFEEIFTT